MSKRSWAATRRQVYERANGCCEYCQTCEYNTGQSLHVEHIIPNGGDDLDNLCLACASCNLSKATATTGFDPLTDSEVPLYNPRIQVWQEHLEWIDNGLRLYGKTTIGRATVARLKMNQPRIIRARHNWILAGTHPPKTDK